MTELGGQDPQVSMEGMLDRLFSHHAPSQEQLASYQAIRVKARELAQVITDKCPKSPDRTAAIRLLRECVFTANSSIATQGGFYL